MILALSVIVLVIGTVFFVYFKRNSHRISRLTGQNDPNYYLTIAINAAKKSMLEGKGGPFGAVIVKNGSIIAVGTNEVTSANDPTAHAEIVAIRKACQQLGSFQLVDCQIYTSCEPCPMCFGAIYWARPSHIYYAASKSDAAQVGFDDSFIYEQIPMHDSERSIKTEQITKSVDKARELFELWQKKNDKISY